jgi:CRP-like cAMP-binding protein
VDNTIETLGLFAGLLLIAGFVMTSIRKLRLFALGAGVAALMAFGANPSEPLPIVLAAAFVLINGTQLGVLMGRERFGRSLVDERGLFAEILCIDNTAQQNRLRDLLTWRDVSGGKLLLEQDQPSPPLIYIAQGRARIEYDGKLIGVSGAGDFVGEMSLVSGKPAAASVIACDGMRVAEFDRDALGHFAREVPELGNAITSALNRGLAEKVARMNAAAAAKTDETAR